MLKNYAKKALIVSAVAGVATKAFLEISKKKDADEAANVTPIVNTEASA